MAYPAGSRTECRNARSALRQALSGDTRPRIETGNQTAFRWQRAAAAIGIAAASAVVVTGLQTDAAAAQDFGLDASVETEVTETQTGLEDVRKLGDKLSSMGDKLDAALAGDNQTSPSGRQHAGSGVDLTDIKTDLGFRIVYTTSDLNVRKHPSTGSEIIEQMAPGDGAVLTAKTTEKRDGYTWYAIQNGQGYVADVGTLRDMKPHMLNANHRILNLDQRFNAPRWISGEHVDRELVDRIYGSSSGPIERAKQALGGADETLAKTDEKAASFTDQLEKEIDNFGQKLKSAFGMSESYETVTVDTADGVKKVAYQPETHTVKVTDNALRVLRTAGKEKPVVDNNPLLGGDDAQGYALVKRTGETQYAVDGMFLTKQAAAEVHPQAEETQQIDFSPGS